MPLIFHRKQNGKTGKKWTARVGKRWVTLKSLDAGEARAEALKLRAELVVDQVEVEAAARAVNHQDEGLPSRPDAGAADPPPAAPAAATSRPVRPDGELAAAGKTEEPGHANGAGAQGFAADINAAAAAAGGAAGDDQADDFDPDELDNFIDDIVAQGGQLAVEVQLRLQEWAWRRYAKIQCAPVPPTHDARKAGAKLWGRALRRWLPKKIPIPDWVAAIAVVMMQTTKVQLGPGVHAVGQPPAAPPPAATDAEFSEAA